MERMQSSGQDREIKLAEIIESIRELPEEQREKLIVYLMGAVQAAQVLTEEKQTA